MRHFWVTMAATVAALLGGAPASAAPKGDPPQQKHPAATLLIPFAPPLGTPLRYRLTRTDSDRTGSTSLDLSIRFERDGSGYRMHSEFQSDAAQAGGSSVERLLEQPIVFDVDEEGIITGLVDEAAYWRRIDAIVGRIAGSEKDMLQRFLKGMQSLPDERRIPLLAKVHQPLLDMAATLRPIGEPLRGEEEVALPFKELEGATFTRRERQSLSALGNDRVTIVREFFFDPATLRDMVERIVALNPKAPPPSAGDLAVTQRLTYVVDRATGLTLEYEEVIEAGAGRERKLRTTRMARIGS